MAGGGSANIVSAGARGSHRTTETELEAGRRASESHDWREAFARLTSAAATASLGAADLDRLAEAAWWLGRLDDCIAARERAFRGFVEEGESRAAALVAIDLAKHNFARQSGALARGWLSRAERLLAPLPASAAHGYLERLRGVIAFEASGDLETAVAHAERALELATAAGDVDLMALALHDKGRVLVAQGRVDEGLALMDEASVGAVAGELRPMTTGIIYCNTIDACEGLADYRRAGEWTDAATRWCDRLAIAGFPGICRVHRAGIMRLRGAWSEADREARRACAELYEFNRGYAGEAFYQVGEGRLHVGDLAGAEEAFRQAHELGRVPEPGLSLVRLAEGDAAAALAGLRRALGEATPPLVRARLLPAAVEATLAAGEPDLAERFAEELEGIAERFGTPALAASAASARAEVLLARGDNEGAAGRLQRARQLWQEVDAPYEIARVRASLGRAYLACGEEHGGRLELEAAHAAFERLGAVIDARRAGELLGEGRRSRFSAADPSQRTFMFTDIASSTPLAEVLGDAAWSDVLRWHDETLRSLFATHGGEEVDHAGDGFFVAFAAAPAAIECAVAIQRRLAEHRSAHGFAPAVRIGLHTTTAARRSGGYRGKGVHAAARIGALAAGGEIVASQDTVATARHPSSGARTVTLKGVARPLDVVTIDWRSPA